MRPQRERRDVQGHVEGAARGREADGHDGASVKRVVQAREGRAGGVGNAGEMNACGDRSILRGAGDREDRDRGIEIEGEIERRGRVAGDIGCKQFDAMHAVGHEIQREIEGAGRGVEVYVDWRPIIDFCGEAATPETVSVTCTERIGL